MAISSMGDAAMHIPSLPPSPIPAAGKDGAAPLAADAAGAPAPTASSIVTLSEQARQQSDQHLQQSVLAALPDGQEQAALMQVQMQASLRKQLDKLLKRTALLEMDVFSELREKLRAQLLQKPVLPPTQRQAADEQFLQRQRDHLPPTAPGTD
ncbi:hypothetical protein G5B88_18995 [Herbaspirillum seropedicae]|uniref:hypothetical protein n=1 Tax=Herbaspirillum seropedicae TaxID=964 RepID=UPI000AF5E37B|nr:hypothetical protein [Herbaspirillum seropedicae]UMU23092.1 hypothetical protein G5B88_18995 [Herbaspirillum seropedicae]